MTTTLLARTPVVQLREHLEYPDTGVSSKILLKDPACQYTLLCLASGTEIRQHTAPCNATVHVLDGNGTLTLNGEQIDLEPGVFVFMGANAPHSLHASSNLAVLLALLAGS